MSELPDPASNPPSSKQQLRAEVLRRRRSLDTATLDRQLLDALAPVLAGARTVAAYAPLAREPGGPELPSVIAAQVSLLLLPLLRPDNDLDWAAYTGPLPPGPGLREPAGPRLGVDALVGADLVLVPALAVDRRTGVRLGRGGGSYDRALARVPAGTRVIALLYPGELLEGVPAEAHDRRVDAVLTPTGLHPVICS